MAKSNEDPYWAPTNFTDWNMYRVAGLASFILWYIAVILWVAVGLVRCGKKKEKFKKEEKESGYEVVSASTVCLFGFIPVGTQFVSKSTKDSSQLKVTKFRCCCCTKVIHFKLDESKITVEYRFCNALSILMAIVFGFLFAFFLHFLPCIWWTCDMGYYDGEQVRGYIWFVGWPCFSIFFLLLGALFQYLKIVLLPSDQRLGTKKIWVSIGNNHVLIAKNYNLSAITGASQENVSLIDDKSNAQPPKSNDSKKDEKTLSQNLTAKNESSVTDSKDLEGTKIEIDDNTLTTDEARKENDQ